MIRITFILLALPLWLSGQAQQYDWWVEKHDWDGVTHWSDYMKFSPGYMGPNALPVPRLERGMIDSTSRLDISARTHWSRGDDTQDLLLRYQHAFIPGRIAVAAEWMAVEHYVTDTTTRDERFSRERDGKGISAGDLNISTMFRLLPEEGRRWGVVFRVNLRTASGDNLKGARHTDAPGYHFDLSTGRWFTLSATTRLRLHATAGFLAYQTNRNDYYQNDCLLYGGGILLSHHRLTVGTELAGYSGYLHMKDDPLLWRTHVALSGRGVEHRLMVQQGLNDWMWTSVAYTASIVVGKAKP